MLSYHQYLLLYCLGVIYISSFQLKKLSIRESVNTILMSMPNPSKNKGASYLQRMVDRKKVEVDNLLRRHQEPDDPIVMRYES